MPAKKGAKKPAAKKPAVKKQKPTSAAVLARYRAFAARYIINRNGTQAYKDTYGITDDNVAAASSVRLLRKEKVKEILGELTAKRNQEMEVSANDVLKLIYDTATADMNELIEYRRLCCRCCWSKNHKYQYTNGEWDDLIEEHERALAKYDREVDKAERKGWPKPRAPRGPNKRGGTGFHKLKPPNPDCPECYGEGIEDVFVKDTRNLSPAARQLYAGIKKTAGGIEVKTHSRDKNLEMLARHVGVLKDKLEVAGPNGGSIPHEMKVTFVGDDDDDDE